jgi:hypothetical protein
MLEQLELCVWRARVWWWLWTAPFALFLTGGINPPPAPPSWWGGPMEQDRAWYARNFAEPFIRDLPGKPERRD